MSERSSSSPAEPFVPFDPVSPGHGAKPAPVAAAKPPSPGAASPALQVFRSDTAPPFTPLETRGLSRAHAHALSSQPVVTLQREGELVTGIRIECACGQVIELACRYEDRPLAP